MSIVKCDCVINIVMSNGSIFELFKRTDNRLSVRITPLDEEYEGGVMVEREAKELRDGLIELYPDVKPSPTWIDVSERLPEEDGLYSVYYPSGLIKLQTLFFSSNIKRFNLFHDSITHWMPLPELPISKESDR